MPPRAVLVGLPGTGKTTTGRRLAKVLCVPFADSDELVEARAGRPVTDIFATDGEPAFRRLEAEAVVAALSDFDGVLALGGGALLAGTTRAAVTESGVAVVWLRADLPTLRRRVGDARTRPLLRGDVSGRLAALAAERDAVYAAVATMEVASGELRPAPLAALIAARLHEQELA
jgi:shikimate kinase